jgi:membrane protein YdbS with pleckstrin-like domain
MAHFSSMRAETKPLIGMVVCLAGFFLFLVLIVDVGLWMTAFSDWFMWFMYGLGAVIWETTLMLLAIFEFQEYRKENRPSQKAEQT